MRLLAIAVAGLAFVTGCDGDDEPTTDAGTAAGPSNAVLAKCENCSRTEGARAEQLADSPDNIRAGPLILYAARQFARAPRSEFGPVRFRGGERSHHRAVKLLLLLEGDDAVKLEIPRSEREHASLLYVDTRAYTRAERRRGVAEVTDGRRAIRFEPHGRGDGPISEIPGGLVVAGGRCLPLRVWAEGAGEPIRRTVSFGVGDRC